MCCDIIHNNMETVYLSHLLILFRLTEQFHVTNVSQPVAFIKVWSLPKNTKWNDDVLLSSADVLLCTVDVGQTVSEERND